ncbi:hypothetical protein HanPI659440_Chr03g0101781 [Helianthus annuus]|nr:hypothetical protein HanPI659440_Chr03g0101781 [Helianthus annuus]
MVALCSGRARSSIIVIQCGARKPSVGVGIFAANRTNEYCRGSIRQLRARW